MKKVVQLYNDYFGLYKKHYNSENVKNEEKRGRDYKEFEITDNGYQEPKSTTKEKTETKKPDEIQKPLWIKYKLNKNEFDSLTEDVYNNSNSDKFKTTVDRKAYHLKNAKKFLLKIITQKLSENEALKLCHNLKKSDIAVLEKTKGTGKYKRDNIVGVLRNLESDFTSLYMHYKDVAKLESEKYIAERTK